MKTNVRMSCQFRDGCFFLEAISGVLLLLLLFTARVNAQTDKAVTTIPPAQQQRLEMMKSKGIDASLTILPVRFMEQPWDRIAELIGVLLEQKGLKNIEVGQPAFIRNAATGNEVLADSLCKFVKGQRFGTDYILYAEMNSTGKERPVEELICIVADKSGEPVWTDFLDMQDEIFMQVEDPDPMGYSMLLAERLGLQIGLNDETARNASPGKMTDLMNARSGIPPESETAPLPERQKVFKENLKQSVLVVYPVRINIKADKDAAEGLVKKINGAGLCRAKLSKEPLLLETPQQDPNELKKLWDLARDFRNYARGKPADADYVLYADYAMPGYVHFVVCDRSGEWVIADFQNSNHPDFRNYNTATVDGCNNLAVTRLQRYTKTSVADAVREAINSSGTDAGYDLFKNVRSKEGYFMSEDEMNNLGYQYMYARKLPEAIAVFKMNVEAFPDSWNPYDSLGEAYAAAGEKELAIENYEKSLKLNPDSPTGKEALKKLKPK